MADFEKKSCKEKRRFKTIRSAWNWAMGKGLRAYRCDFCKGAHLTSKDFDFERAYDSYEN